MQKTTHSVQRTWAVQGYNCWQNNGGNQCFYW